MVWKPRAMERSHRKARIRRTSPMPSGIMATPTARSSRDRERRGGTSAMKGFKGKIPDQDIWNVINYVRSLGPKEKEDVLTRSPTLSLCTRLIGVLAVCLAASAGCRVLDSDRRPVNSPLPPLPGQPSGSLRRRVRRWRRRLRDFLNRRPVASAAARVSSQHAHRQERSCARCATRAWLPVPSRASRASRVHDLPRSDRDRPPAIQQITAMRDKGIDLAWQRVLGFANEDHVKFNHAPHIRAKVDAPPATAIWRSRRSPSAASTTRWASA